MCPLPGSPGCGEASWGSGQASFPAGSVRGTPVVSGSCGEPSPAPWISRALGASLMGAQTPKVAEKETSEGPGAPWHMKMSAPCLGRMFRPQRTPRKRCQRDPEPCNA